MVELNEWNSYLMQQNKLKINVTFHIKENKPCSLKLHDPAHSA